MNPSRATIPLIRPHQCDSEGGRIRGVLLYCNSFMYLLIYTEYIQHMTDYNDACGQHITNNTDSSNNTISVTTPVIQ